MKPEYGYRLMDNYKDIFTLENEGTPFFLRSIQA